MKGSRTTLLFYLRQHPYHGDNEGSGATLYEMKENEGFSTAFSGKVVRQWLRRGIVRECGKPKETANVLTTKATPVGGDRVRLKTQLTDLLDRGEETGRSGSAEGRSPKASHTAEGECTS